MTLVQRRTVAVRTGDGALLHATVDGADDAPVTVAASAIRWSEKGWSVAISTAVRWRLPAALNAAVVGAFSARDSRIHYGLD